MVRINIDNIDLEKTKLKTSIKTDKKNVKSSIKLDIVNIDGTTQTLRIRNIAHGTGVVSLCEHLVDCDKTKVLEFKCTDINNKIAEYFKTLLITENNLVIETVTLANFVIDRINK